MSRSISTLILDVDGVLLDSNKLKKDNVRQAAMAHANGSKLDEFVQYFIGMNGVPREQKVEHHFGKGSEATQKVLAEYNRLNESSLADAPLTEGAIGFLEGWSKQCPIYALSGGTQDEVRSVLRIKGIAKHFADILGGPVTKSAHLQRMALPGRILFVGDSRHDAEVAEEFDFDFLFMYRYSQFDEWQDYFQSRPKVTIISDLTSWPNTLRPTNK